MKKIICIIMLCLTVATTASASTIVVAGKQIKIPTRYNPRRVEERANKCVIRTLPKLKTDKAIDLLPTVCVEAVIIYGASWDKHI